MLCGDGFGKSDIDRAYDDHILPTLRAARIQSTFRGRLEHSDDISKRIIEEIEECDFAIADLTHARPSVYFEARVCRASPHLHR